MTEQRDRVITDPGIGPVELDSPSSSTLRSIAAAAEVTESPGAPVYYEPKPLNASSDHKTLEIETVKLSHDIDPRKLPTELSLPRAPFVPQFDSGWPLADVVLTSSQRPAPPGRRWRVRAVLLALLSVVLLLVWARGAARRTGADREAANAESHVSVAAPMLVLTAKPPPPPLVIGPGVSADSSATPAAPSAEVSAPVLTSAAPALSAATRAPQRSSSTVSLRPGVKDQPLSASASAKPKRAIY